MKKYCIAIALVSILMMALPIIVGGAKPEGDPVRVIVMFNNDGDHSDLVDDSEVILDLEIINGVAMMATPGRINSLKNNDDVKSVSIDHWINAAETSTPYTRLSWGVNRIDADLVWDHKDSEDTIDGTTGEGINVAILDTGVDINHPDLPLLGAGINFVADVNRLGRVKAPAVPTAFDDDNGHGTHCAGIVAGNEFTTGHGMIGVARGATINPVKVLDSRGSGLTSWLVKGIDWCTYTNVDEDLNPIVDVISMSLSSSSTDSAVQTACDNAASAGIILVAAAGNNGDDDLTTDEDNYPASYNSVISVGATDRNENHPWWSASSPYWIDEDGGFGVEVSAPGVDIYSTYMGGGYATMSGTSMACPHVAGTVALMLGVGTASSDIRDDLLLATDDILPTGVDHGSGFGLVDALIACGFSDTFAPMSQEITLDAEGTSVTIKWLTDEPSKGSVYYGTNTDAMVLSEYEEPSDVTSHEITITGLVADTLYYFQPSAKDIIGNLGEGNIKQITTEGGTSTTSSMHVGSIVLTSTSKGVNKYLTAKITILDEDDGAVSGATVGIKLEQDDTLVTSSSAVTGTDGVATFTYKLKTSDTYTVTVTSVTKTDWDYDSSSNIETSDSLPI